MPVPRPALALRAANSLAQTSTLRTSSQVLCKATRSISTTASKQAEHAHEDHYDPPTGWLFGVKPGEKYQKEGWETVWVWGFFGSLGLAAVAYAFKPDTS